MTLGSCLISNEFPGLKGDLIQARIDGKSWKEISDEFNFSSVQVARKNFRKITGINDLKIKGKALKDIIDKGMIDTLKSAVPKIPKVPKVSAPVQAQKVDTFIGKQAGGKFAGTPIDDIMHEAFPDKLSKQYLQSVGEVEKFNTVQYKYYSKRISNEADFVKDAHGFDYGKMHEIHQDLSAGKYYSDLTSKYGLTFDELDKINYDRLVNNITDSHGTPNSLWNAYKSKPTSENGFKTIQDTVWNMRKASASEAHISVATGVPKNVIKMILDDSWSLPAKGAKEFIGYEAPETLGWNYSASKTATELVGDGKQYEYMTFEQAEEFRLSFGSESGVRFGDDLNHIQSSALGKYRGNGYTDVNDPLRGRYGQVLDDETKKKADVISSTMRPLPHDVTLARGVGEDVFPGGVPSPGDVFTDRGFMSTSFGGQAAFGGKYYLHISAPAGTPARPLHDGYPTGEKEILLDKGLRFLITGVQHSGHSSINIFMKVIL